MGFRSNFISNDMSGIEIPKWFLEKYPDHIYGTWDDKYIFPIIQLWESKFYIKFENVEIFKDIQIILKEIDLESGVVIILLHECGGITRVKITPDSITGREPETWKDVEEVGHSYCYGCSDKIN